jgi:hypothetical protein
MKGNKLLNWIINKSLNALCSQSVDRERDYRHFGANI